METRAAATGCGIRLSRRRSASVLGWIVGGLVAVHLVFVFLGFAGQEAPASLLDLSEKISLPNTCSAFALLLAAGLLRLIAGAKRREDDRDARHWNVLAAGFAVMSLDRIACIHQMFNTYSPVAWEIPGAVVVALIGLSYVGFMRRLPPRTRSGFLVSGTVYVFGVIVVEALLNPYLLNIPVASVQDLYLMVIHEGTQMLGAVLFISALLAYMRAAPDATGVAMGEPATARYRFEVRPGRAAAWLAGIGAALVVAHLALPAAIRRIPALPQDPSMLFDVTLELSVPSWFLAAALTCTSALLLAIGVTRAHRAGHGAWPWLVLSAGALLLAIDKTAGLEFWLTAFTGLEWWQPGLVMAVLSGLASLRALSVVSPRVRWEVLAGGAACTFGAFCLAAVTASPDPVPAIGALGESWASALGAGLETAGVSLVLHALLVHVSGPRGAPATIAVEITA
jgi:hypothetical protein